MTEQHSTKLRMLSFSLALDRLMRLAVREHLLPPGDDLGYALHAVFLASFGQLAPRPFVLLPPGTQGRAWRLLAYSPSTLEELRAQAGSFGDPDFLAPLALDDAAEKAMPETFPVGARLGFRLRIRPTVRTGKPNPKNGEVADAGRAVERDAYLTVDPADGLDRGAVYSRWLAARLAKAGAGIESASLDAFRRTRLMTRKRADGGKGNCYAEGPDATLSGVLRVTDINAFAAGLAQGIGRHRAFGFGMLLLTPAGRQSP